MLNAGKKTVIAALLLMFSSSQVVRAEVKLYQYDGKLPFVQMMLNMMVAMGILDRLPSNSRYGLAGYPSSSWGGLSNPYARALAMRGFSPGSSFASPYGNNPFMRSPWLQSPWSAAAVDGADWGSPSWGVLPVESYPRSPYGYGAYDSLPANPYWSSDELAGWVNEPWETSTWNPKAEKPVADKSSQPQTTQPKNTQPVPLVQNFNYHAPASETSNTTDRRPSPLAKLAPSARAPVGRSAESSYRQPPPNVRTQQNPENKSFRNKPASSLRQKPCITEFCGLKKPNLDGLWVAQDGEMLGIKNNRYLWSDSNSRYLTGKLKIQNEYLLANVDGYERLMRFKYKLAGNHLLTMQPDGKIRAFTRMRGDQYNNYNQGDYRQPYY